MANGEVSIEILLPTLPPLESPIVNTDALLVVRDGVSYRAQEEQFPISILERNAILARLAALEVSAPPPDPPPPNPAPADFTFTFTSGALPANVTVARTGTVATYLDSSGVLQIAAANTARLTHTTAGVRRGLYCESARTNSLVDGRYPGKTPTWLNVGTPVGAFTLNHGTGPDGVALSATRFLMDGGAPNAYFGKRKGIPGLSGTAPIHVAMWAKSLSAGKQLYGFPKTVITPSTSAWTLYEATYPAATGFNVDLAGTTLGTDLLLAWMMLSVGGKIDESVILTDGAAATRPKELITFGGLTAGTYDITITFAAASGYADQVIVQQVVAATTYVLDADLLVGNILGVVEFSPTTAAPPPAPPPVPGSGIITIDMAIFDMAAKSDEQPAFGRHNSAEAVIQMPCNQAAITGMCRQFSGWRTDFDLFVNAANIWLWAYLAPGHNPTVPCRVQCRNLYYSLLSVGNPVWEDFPPINKINFAQAWHGNVPGGGVNIRNEVDGVSYFIQGNEGFEAWAESFYLIKNRAKIMNSFSFGAVCQVRVIRELLGGDGEPIPYIGNDARYSIKMGGDVHIVGNPTNIPTAAGISCSNRPYGKDCANYPLFMMDGGNSRWKTITGSMGWQPIVYWNYASSYEVAVGGIGAPNPWGNFAQPPWPYGKAAYNVTEAQIRANHPGWMY